MSPSNVEIARRSYEAFEQDDLDAVLADMDDGLPHGGVYHGLAEVRRNIFEPLDAEWWAEFHAVPHEFLDGGADVVVLGRYTGRAKETGRALDVPYVHVWTFADGRAVRFRQFLDTAGWNAALGRDGTTA